MPNLPDASLPILASLLSPATAAKAMLAIFGVIIIVASLHYASPTRLARVLSDAMNGLEKLYLEMAMAGLLGLLPSDDIHTVVSTMQLLRVEVGMLKTEALRNSKSWRASLLDFFTGRSVSLFRCIKEVKDFQTHLKILQEDHRHRTNSLPLSLATGVSRSARFRTLTA
ncbi:hypothetical protein C8F04DRAFT_1251175 [Mycena alexandri]|uniref:Uncharacterized protein n=1 Tax=Mycena alexandri TaxID=1745969 RepID=A0AAD6XBH2_9AGAR|nr:hypothetical protein C8F04DRAFT_1251175 [Mycena alexandri]